MNWKITYILFFTSLILFAGSCSKEEEEITDDLKYSLLFTSRAETQSPNREDYRLGTSVYNSLYISKH